MTKRVRKCPLCNRKLRRNSEHKYTCDNENCLTWDCTYSALRPYELKKIRLATVL